MLFMHKNALTPKTAWTPSGGAYIPVTGLSLWLQ